MILFANFLLGIAKIIDIALMIFIWILIIRVVLSWVQVPALYSFSVIIYQLTEPVLRPVRKFVPPYKMGGIDISPMLVILLIVFIDTFLVKSLSLYAQQILRGQTLNF